MIRRVVDPTHPDPAIMAEAGAAIRRGELVAFPTETVYGLGADATNPEALARIFAAKGRPFSDPLIVHVAGADALAALCASVPPHARELADRFWPGPLTLVVPRHPSMPAVLSAGLGTIGVRVPAHPVAAALIRAAGVPIAAPSANLFTRPSPTTADHVAQDLDGRIDMLLDAGPTAHGLESTVLDLTRAVPVVLRPGATSLERLREVLPLVAVHERFLGEDEQAAAPGQMLKHYSPRAETVVFSGQDAGVVATMRNAVALAIGEGRKVGVLVDDDSARAFSGLDVLVARLGDRNQLEAVGARLFAGLRELDAAGVDVIFSRTYGDEGMGLAIRDRLLRAAEGHVVSC